MDNVIALPSTSATTQPGYMDRLAALPAARKMGLAAGLAALAAVIVALTLWSSRPDYKVLYANLSDRDGGAIIAQLAQMNVPYQHADGGAAILVPADKVHDTRLKLASAGLPKGSTVGFELMDNARFGITQFQERLTFQRGLEGELTRSIEGLAAVSQARVHLALPSQNGFFREQQKPSASVLLRLHPGRTLERAQIAGIVHLVSSSVSELSPKAVSIVDQDGALLTEVADAKAMGLDSNQLQYIANIESGYARRITEILDPVVGRDNLRAQVTADIDFTQSESTSEQYRPNQGGEPAAVRSQQSAESTQASGGLATGIPGATSNQPPVPATAPVNAPAQALQAAGAGAPASQGKRDMLTNFELDKTVRVTRNASGTVRRLSVAVVVNHRAVTDARGKAGSAALTPDELAKLSALVRESIGFNAARGDSVQVVNAAFREHARVDAPELPLWKQPQVLELARQLAVPGLLAVLVLVIVFGVVRPALRAVAAPTTLLTPVGRKVDTVVGDAEGLPALANTLDRPAGQALSAAEATGLAMITAPMAPEKLQAARQFARDNPVAVANIVRSWVSHEAA